MRSRQTDGRQSRGTPSTPPHRWVTRTPSSAGTSWRSVVSIRSWTPDARSVAGSILDPNRAVDNNYFGYTVTTQDGRVLTGIIAAETASSITLKQPEGKVEVILRDEIDELKGSGLSLMPVGLEKNIDAAQMADLITFLKNWRYIDGNVPAGK